MLAKIEWLECKIFDSQCTTRFTLNARVVGTALAANLKGHWVRAAVERFDWKTRAALRKKSRKSWDAVRQLIHYREVVGVDTPISEQSLESGDLFRDGLQPSPKASGSD